MSRKSLIVLILLSVMLSVRGEITPPDTSRTEPSSNLIKALVRNLFTVYEKGITVTETHNCPMTPNCSRFSKIAIEREGLIKGLLLTSDRLIRDNKFAHHYYPKDERGKLIDPVERYTEWKKPSRPY